MKKILSLFLITLLIFTSLPIVYATDIYESEEKLDYSSGNAVGETIVDAIDEVNQSVEENNGFGVFGLYLNDLIANVSFSAPDNATLVVAVYNEETGVMVTSGKAQVNSDMSNVEVTLADCIAPDYYIIKAFILNEDNIPACSYYENREHTKAYKEFFEKNIYDFDEDKVINFDISDESNFAVVNDNAVVVTYSENKNIVVKDDYENGVYVIQNADSNITSLESGDIFYYVYGYEPDEYILTKVGSITTENGLTTIIAADDCEMEELFSYIDIDSSKIETPQVFSFDEESGQINESKTYPLTSGSEEKEFKGNNYSLKLSAKGSITFNIKFHYDINLFSKDYYKFEYWVAVDAQAEAEFNASGSFEKRCDIIETSIPVFAGVDVHIEINITIKASASINVVGTITFSMKNGASRETGGVQQKIEQKPTVEFNLDIDGKYSISIIPELITGFEILKVFYVDLSVPVDFNTSGTLFVPTSYEEYRDHLCLSCIAGDVTATVKLNINVKFGLKRDKAETIIEITPVSKTFDIGKYYISFNNGIKFGWGLCPNITQKVTVNVYDNNGNPVKDAVVSTTTGYCDADGDGNFNETSTNTDENGQAVFYFKKGNHEVVVKKDGIGTSGQKFEVLAIEKEINLVLFDAEYFNGHYYKAFDENLNWLQAKRFCEDLGGHLVTISSEKENSLVCSLIPKGWDGALIGLSDASEEGHWKWVTNEPFTFSKWDRNEPNNQGNEDYAGIGPTSYWNDGHFEREQRVFICEWETIPSNAQVKSYRIASQSISEETTNETIINGTTASRTDALIGAEYVAVAVKDEFVEDIFANDNLIYIDQKTAESSTVSFDFVIPEGVENYAVKIFGVSHTHSPDAAVTENIVDSTCSKPGSYESVTYCTVCGEELSRDKVETPTLPHNYSKTVAAPTCTAQGFTTYTCSCGDSYSEEIAATGHNFDGSVCENCGYDKSDNCSCNCHAGGIKGFFFKFLLFFQKIFRTNKVCKCGINHY